MHLPRKLIVWPLLVVLILLGVLGYYLINTDNCARFAARSGSSVDFFSPNGAYKAAIEHWTTGATSGHACVRVYATADRSWFFGKDKEKDILVYGLRDGDAEVRWQGDDTLVLAHTDADLIQQGAWHGVNFIYQKVPWYRVILQNDRPERVSRREGDIDYWTIPPYSINPCTEGEFVLGQPHKGWRLVYRNGDGSVVFDIKLQGEVIGDQFIVKDSLGNLIQTTLLKAAYAPTEREIRLVIPGDPGNECP